MNTPGRVENHHNNALGFFRLLFASLVIISHVAEVADGDRHREILTKIFGTLSFGELAVTGFFIISGYLISASFLSSASIISYLRKRVVRIYPAFIVAFIICVFLVAPLGGATHFTAKAYAHEIVRLLALLPPDLPAFPGSHIPVLNGAMWTIAYEFRCYVLVIILGVTGAFKRKWIIPSLSLLCMIFFHVLPPAQMAQLEKIPYSDLVVGGILPDLRFIGIFLMGSTFFLYRDKIHFTAAGTIAAFFAMLIALSIRLMPDTSVAISLGFFIFGVATLSGDTWLTRINNDNDISYGVYLYGWPITKLINWWWPTMDLALVGTLTFLGACACGWLSWRIVEKPVMSLMRSRSRVGYAGLDRITNRTAG